jgi:hypothetical protein
MVRPRWAAVRGDPGGSARSLLGVIRLSRESGQLLAAEPIEAQPSGVLPMHDPDGWVGLDVGEGQDGSEDARCGACGSSRRRFPRQDERHTELASVIRFGVLN